MGGKVLTIAINFPRTPGSYRSGQTDLFGSPCCYKYSPRLIEYAWFCWDVICHTCCGYNCGGFSSLDRSLE